MIEVHLEFYEDNKKLESLSWNHAMTPSCCKCKVKIDAIDIQSILKIILYRISNNEAYHPNCVLPLKGTQL